MPGVPGLARCRRGDERGILEGVYDERSSRLLPGVLWTTRHEAEGHVLPDGCMDLIWFGDQLLVAGPDTTPQLVAAGPAIDVIGLRFAPGVGPHVMGVPARELTNSRVPVDDLWEPAVVRRVSDELAASEDPGTTLEHVASERLLDAEPVPRELRAVVAMIRRGDRVSTIADHVGLSERQLHRRALTSFGYGPKVLGRILRFRRAAQLIGAGVPKAAVAAITGYADQPHMAREFRRLSGRSAGALAGDL